LSEFDWVDGEVVPIKNEIGPGNVLSLSTHDASSFLLMLVGLHKKADSLSGLHPKTKN